MYNCNCNCCKRRYIRVTEAEITGGTLVLTTEITGRTVYNGERDVICICTDIPASAAIVPVEIVINGTNSPMQDVLGNTLQSDQIQSRCAYPGVWGTQPLHFKLAACVQRSGATATSVEPGEDTAGA